MMSKNTPLVSCIMPTYNRREFVPNAIRYFLRQDYENKELIVLDDGTDCVEDLMPKQQNIKYIRLTKHLTLGEKRNFCVRESQGNLIMHWDDDDWIAPYRISYQVEELLAHKAEVCGLQQMYFYELETKKCWLYKYPSHARPWLAGGSLLYTKTFWEALPFPNIQIASDTPFILSRNLQNFVVLFDYDFYVASIHKGNTSPKRTENSVWNKIDYKVVEKIMNDNKINGSKSMTTSIGNSIEKSAIENGVSSDKVTACLISYKRPQNMQLIVDSLHRHSFIDEIIVWNNNSNIRLALKGDKVRIINSLENKICYGRFLCVQQAKNQIIYVQDDDAIVHNIVQLFQKFKQKDDRITHGLQPNHYRLKKYYHHFFGQVALLGWGAFFRKDKLTVLEKFLEENEEDYLFLREADQIFTILQQENHQTILADIQLLNHHSDRNIALYREEQHYLHKALAVNKALAFNRNQKSHHFPVTWNIVIPCKNYGQYLEDALQSVLYNAADYVITIVDDGSTDNSEKIGRRYANDYSFINYIKNKESKGVSYARNRGIAAVESLFVILLDADDKIGRNYLSEAEKLLRKGCDITNPDAILFGHKQARWKVPDRVSLSMLLQRNHVHTCAAFRRSYWIQVGGIDENLDGWQDYEYWIRLAAAGARIKRLSGDHFFYRKHGFSKSNVSNTNRQSLRTYIEQKHSQLFKNKKS